MYVEKERKRACARERAMERASEESREKRTRASVIESQLHIYLNSFVYFLNISHIHV